MLQKALFVAVLATWLVVLVQSGVILRNDENEVVDDNDGDGIDLPSLGKRKPGRKVGELVAKDDPEEDWPNPGEFGSHFEGDILLHPAYKRNGIRFDVYPSSKWPNGIVPYVIDSDFTSSEKQFIRDSMEEFDLYTCIKLVPRTYERDFIVIRNQKGKQSGCYSFLGRIGGAQTLNLQHPGCLSRGTVQHELIHAIGITHEHNRYDRDDYVTVLWSNIDPTWHSQYEITSTDDFGTYGVEYDYGSVMHYPLKAPASKNDAFVLLQNYTGELGQRNGMAFSDISKLNRMYNCVGYPGYEEIGPLGV